MIRWMFALVLTLTLACSSESTPVADPAAGAGADGGAEDRTTGEDPAKDPEQRVDPNEVPADAITWNQHVQPIVEANCARCHSEGGIREQVPLVTYDDVRALAPLMKEKVAAREMPPWQAGPGCSEYVFDESLNDEEIAVISEWADTGALEGAADAEPVPSRDRVFASLSREDITMEMPVEYVMAQSPDDYRCFVLEWPHDETKFITGFGARPGNVAVVHHIIGYMARPSAAQVFRDLDANEPGPGYTCFGGPGGGGQGLQGTDFIGGWAPGGVGGDFPAGTGMKVEPGSVLVLQLHYNTLDVEPQKDQTSVVFKVDDSVEREAFVMPFTNFQWVLGNGMEIPAGEADVMHTYTADPFMVIPYLKPGQDSDRFEVHTSTMHMHVLGTKARTWIQKADGTEECMLDIPNYDFGWQRTYGFETPKVIEKGDRIGVECHWDNTAANQQWIGNTQMEPVDQKWGEGTTDEMCVGFFYLVGQ